MDEGKRGGIALGEQRKEEVFAVVEACVRMLLLSLVQRETEAPGGGEAGGGRGGVARKSARSRSCVCVCVFVLLFLAFHHN